MIMPCAGEILGTCIFWDDLGAGLHQGFNQCFMKPFGFWYSCKGKPLATFTLLFSQVNPKVLKRLAQVCPILCINTMLLHALSMNLCSQIPPTTNKDTADAEMGAETWFHSSS